MARDFNGSTQYLTGSTAPPTTSPVTLAAWVRPDRATHSEYIVSLGNTATPAPENGLFLNLGGATGGDPVRAISFAGGSAAIATAGTFTTGSWQHIAAVFASTTSRTAYYNGVAGTANTTSNSPSGIDAIKIAVNQANAFHFDGGLAEVAVWNVALSATEIAALAARVSPLRIRPSALVYYPSLYGLSSPENDMVSAATFALTGTPTAMNHPPVAPPFFQQGWTTYTGGAAPPVTAPYFWPRIAGGLTDPFPRRLVA